MLHFEQVKGQALVESLVILSMLAAVAMLVAEVIMPNHERALERVDNARATLWMWQPETQVTLREDYAFAAQSSPILATLKALTGFSLAQDNLRQISASEDYAPMARITDPWSPLAVHDLAQRPAQLTPISRMQELGIDTLQDFVSWLPFTEEFAADSLRFGFVEDLATPSELVCRSTLAC